MRLPRLTTRRLMAAVVAALSLSLSLCGVSLSLLRVEYRRRATWHAAQAAGFQAYEHEAVRMIVAGRMSAGEMAWSRWRAYRHSERKRIYEAAAARPWLPVPPDPPLPKP